MIGPLQEEVVRIIGELATVQGKVKQATYEEEEKITTLTAQGEEEIEATKAMIIKEVEVVKEASQNFIVAWKSRQ
jgi:DNA-directed RNA polymerase alpha subunit